MPKHHNLGEIIAPTYNHSEIIRPRDLPKYTGLSRTTIWRLIRRNAFVPKIMLTPSATGFRLSDIEKWLADRTVVSSQGV